MGLDSLPRRYPTEPNSKINSDVCEGMRRAANYGSSFAEISRQYNMSDPDEPITSSAVRYHVKGRCNHDVEVPPVYPDSVGVFQFGAVNIEIDTDINVDVKERVTYKDNDGNVIYEEVNDKDFIGVLNQHYRRNLCLFIENILQEELTGRLPDTRTTEIRGVNVTVNLPEQ